jgi:hypothetical protein
LCPPGLDHFIPSRLMMLSPFPGYRMADAISPLGRYTNIPQRTEIEFKIYYTSGRTNDAVYSIRIGASVTGIVLTPLKTYSRFRQIHLDGVN